MKKLILILIFFSFFFSVSNFVSLPPSDQILKALAVFGPWIVAENFGETFPNFKTPVVESGGSSAGLKEFCKGVGEATIDIANASRKIRDREIEACAANGVTEIIEVRIGYDGIVFASQLDGPGSTHKPPPQSAVQAHSPASSSQKQVDGTQPSITHSCPSGQPVVKQPAGLGPSHPPGSVGSTQMPGQSAPPMSGSQPSEGSSTHSSPSSQTRPRKPPQGWGPGSNPQVMGSTHA